MRTKLRVNTGYIRNWRTGRVVVPGGGSAVHPGGTAARGGRRMGITPFRYCVQCGVSNDTRTTPWSKDGEGLVFNEKENETEVKSGCKFCGSLFWQWTKPRKLPDDAFLSARWARLWRKRMW